ncbi:MAG: 3-oxoacyl-[acyl-carrier-protein] synthase 2 [Alphaproteobacteria bacterium MarineAlpha5_Bin9]|mgnify:CR=1 FL=1|nr:MAG: 3-oxoacyl-[acyl-carrier-protein] synthase 2 [Alphaproteobacteria bacterium MarineAlpha5_Bin9]
MRRVVVTGMGLVTSIGNNVKDTWENLLACKSGIKKIVNFETSDLSCKIAGYLSHDPADKIYFDLNKFFENKEIKRNDRFILYGLIAAKEAIDQSGILNLNDESRDMIGVSVGSGIGGLETIYNNSNILDNRGPRKISPFFVPASLINLLSGQISIKYNFKGPNHSVVTACATGSHSIGDASEIIKRGVANVMISGGAEAAVCRLGLAGFCAARSLSTNFNNLPQEASRPWDRDRDGFVMGEGGGVLVLEELEHAKKRGAEILAEVVGYGMSGDAFHITSPSEDGSGGLRAMKSALKMASISSDQIDYINAHGTSTQLGDDIELNAIKKLIDENKKIKISSTKSSIGHLLGAAGSVEAVFSILSIKNNIVPATLNLHNPSNSYNLDLVPHKPKEHNTKIALSNSFGFGGTNTSVIFKSFD